ncbi:MAG: ParB/RepB/Spo0J family partition protein [Candidatus Acidiferrales bacterium]
MARNALGRGLSALIREPENTASPPPPPTPTVAAQVHEGPSQGHREGGLVQIDIDLIDPSPYQPRTRFREEALEELARSLRTSGIIQPLVVRPKGPRFQLIAGERRWRAAQRAAISRVPAVVRDVDEESALEITLVENLQREDLNPIEEASAFERLIDQFHLTQEQVAERTGKDRATVANALRLRKLEKPIQELLEDGAITAGHGRALLAIQDSRERLGIAKRAARGGMTVRQVERLATRPLRGGSPMPAPQDANTNAAIEELQREFGTRVLIHPKTSGRPGQLIFEYYNEADLARLYDRLIKA